MVEAAAPSTPMGFAFSPVDGPALSVIETREHAMLLNKWGLGGMLCHRFRFDRPFSRSNTQQFLLSFFNDPNVRGFPLISSSRGNPGCMMTKVDSVKWKELSVQSTSMSFFDRLTSVEDGVVRDSDETIKCLDKYLEGGVVVADRMREMFMCGDDAEACFLYEDADKDELLYHVMWRLVAGGGGLCQYEDLMTPYRDVCKALYKDLVRAQRNPTTGRVEVVSVALQVLDTSAGLWVSDQPNHNFCYIIVDPVQKLATYWYGTFTSAW